MYRTDFEVYKNKKIKEFPKLKKEINQIWSDAISHRQCGSFWFSIAHTKVKKLIEKHRQKKIFKLNGFKITVEKALD